MKRADTKEKFEECQKEAHKILEILSDGISNLEFKNPNIFRLRVLKGDLELLLEKNKKYFLDTGPDLSTREI